MENPFECNNYYYTEKELASCGFKKIGQQVKIHKTAILHNLNHISLGNDVRIDPFVTIIATSTVDIGSFIHIGSHSFLSAAHPIVMDDFAGLSQAVKIYTASDDYSGMFLTNPSVPKKYRGGSEGPVHLKKHVIVGAGSIILPNLTVEEGVAVGSLSLVSQNLEAWSIYAGVPVKRIRSRMKNLLELEKKLQEK